MANALILASLALTVLAIVASYSHYLRNRKRLSQAKYAHYAATSDDVAHVDYSAEVDLSNKHFMEILLVGAIAVMMGYGVAAGYHEFVTEPQPEDKSMLWFFVVVWLFFVALFGRMLLALRDLFRERGLYMRTRGKEIALREDDLFLSLMLFDGPGRDLLRLHNKPYFRLPLKEVTAFRADPSPASRPVSGQDHIQVCFADNPEGFHISRIHIERHENDLLLILEKKLTVPIEL